MMATKKRSSKKPHLLSHTRPRTCQTSTSLSSRVTRKLIRSHHTLQKQLASALLSNNAALVASLQAQHNDSGGLEMYQRASIIGQSSERGGDSSKVLMGWLAHLLPESKALSNAGVKPTGLKRHKYKMLEVGALSPHNACSRSNLFEVQSIDLHSQHASILEQDFMLRPVPAAENLEQEGFDVVSLSLVVNFVPDARGRAEMLKLVRKFLRSGRGNREGGEEEALLPGLFLVLPLSCVENSRYLNEEKLELMMGSLGFILSRRKTSKKLVYYFWRYEGEVLGREVVFAKEQIRKGDGRNNFAIVFQ